MMITFCRHLFCHLDDSNVQTRYLMLMNVALKKDIEDAYNRDTNIINFTLGEAVPSSKNNNQNSQNSYEEKQDTSSGAATTSMFRGLLRTIVSTKVIQESVVNSFREVVGIIMTESISLLDAQKINQIVTGIKVKKNKNNINPGNNTNNTNNTSDTSDSNASETKGRQFIQAVNVIRPLELNPEPYLVAEEMMGSISNPGETNAVETNHSGDRELLNIRLYTTSQSNDRELFHLVNDRATVMMNNNQKWFASFLRFFQTLPVGIRWLCNQFSVHLHSKYSSQEGTSSSSNSSNNQNKVNLKTQTTVAVLDFIFTEIVLPILNDDSVWIDVAVKEKWGATVENRTDVLYWTSGAFQKLKI